MSNVCIFHFARVYVLTNPTFTRGVTPHARTLDSTRCSANVKHRKKKKKLSPTEPSSASATSVSEWTMRMSSVLHV